MPSTLTEAGWVVRNDIVDERAPLPRLTQAEIDAINAEIAAGSNNYPTGTQVIRISDETVFQKYGVGTAARFVQVATGTDVAAAVAAISAQETTSVAAVMTQETTSVAAVVSAQSDAEAAIDVLVTGAEAAMALATASLKIYPDYATAVAATADGDFFSVYSSDLLARLIYKRASGQGELQGVAPFLRSASAEAARVLAGSQTFDAQTTVPADLRLDFIPVDSLFGYMNLRNRAWTARAPDLNIFGVSRPADFVSGHLTTFGFGTAPPTVTMGVAGPDGALKAVRLQYVGAGTSAWGALPPAAVAGWKVPAGRWTVAYEAISNSGAAANYRMQSGSSTATLSAVTVTALSWPGTVVSTTFVLSADTDVSQMRLFREAAVPSAVDVTIDNIRWIPGSATGSASTTSEHLHRPHGLMTLDGMVGKSTGSTSTGMRSMLHLPASETFTGMTVTAAVRREAAGNNFLFSDQDTGTSGFHIRDISTIPGIYVGKNGGSSDMIRTPLNDWIIYTFAGDSTGCAMYMNELKVYSSTTPLTSFSTAFFSLFGLSTRQDNNFVGKGGCLKMVDRRMTDDEVVNTVRVAKANLAAQGERLTEFGSFLIAEGDSNTDGSGATNKIGYAKLLGPMFTPHLQGISYAVGGSVLQGVSNSIDTRKTTVDAKIAEVLAAGKRPIVSVLIGSNDLVSLTSNALADTYYANLKVYWAARRAAGAKLVAYTIPMHNGVSAACEAVRVYLNGLIRGDTTQYDALADLAADANLNVWNSTYFADSVHLSNDGHALAATIAAAAITTVWLP